MAPEVLVEQLDGRGDGEWHPMVDGGEFGPAGLEASSQHVERQEQMAQVVGLAAVTRWGEGAW